jgi:predicted MFS family arabinose efflux permease
VKSTSASVTRFDSVTKGYRGYVLALLTLVFIINFIDRQVLSVLIEPIKRELDLSDTQLGLLSGLAFALFYVTAGVPIARLADLKSRRNLIAVCMIVWSAMTSLCGVAVNFTQLLLARMGVAIGEAGCVAPSHSILSDYFRPADRPIALSIYSAGASLGVFLGLLGGGWLADAYGWRWALILIGLPGIAVALIVMFTLREPMRGMSLPAYVPSATPAPSHFWSDLGELFRRRTLVFIALAGGFQSMVTYGIATWLPAFFMRVHGMSASTAGTWLAIINGLVAGLGAIIGGSVTARLSRDERRWLLWVPAMAAVVSTPLYAFAVWSPSSFTSLLFLAPAAFLSMMYVGPALAATHGVAGVKLRATGVALTLFVSNLLGIGGGALLVGMVSDSFAPVEPLVSLRYGLLAVLVANVPAMVGYLLAAQNVRNDWHE